jgi:hypothetical protein
MATYFKVGNLDLSSVVNELKVNHTANYNAQTNAAGDTVVDYINTKRTIEVGLIPMEALRMNVIQQALEAFSVSISFLNPRTGALEEGVACIIPDSEIEYYTIQDNKKSFKGCNLKFIEL